MPIRAISNQQAHGFYRRAIEASLKHSAPLIESGEAWGRHLQIAAQWLARYTRRRDVMQGEDGWGHRLKDVQAVQALIARNLAKEAEWPLLPMWDGTTRSVIDTSLKNAYQTQRLDVAALGDHCRFGPSLRRLWGEARAQGLSDEKGWETILSWATRLPEEWASGAERAKSKALLPEPFLSSVFEIAITWGKTGDLDFPWATEHEQDKLQVRLNDFPDERMYTLVVNGTPVLDFDDWPEAWDRGERPRDRASKRVALRLKVSTSPVQGRFMERYLGGEREAVWSELVALGPRVREQPYVAEATAVARETMRRARRNIELIIHRLDKLGYRFWNGPKRLGGSKNHLYDPGVFLPPTADEKAKLDELERQGLVLPLSLRMWMEEVGRVDLTGSHVALCPLEHDEGFAGIYADPLMVIPNANSLRDMLALDGEREHDLFISHDDWGKAAIGTNEQLDSSYSLEVPNLGADGLLMGERHNIQFIEYLRLSFRWGGFSGWEHEVERPARELAVLTDHLLPL